MALRPHQVVHTLTCKRGAPPEDSHTNLHTSIGAFSHSANHYGVYPRNTPKNHPPTEACMQNSMRCRIQDPGTRGYRWGKQPTFRTAHGAPPIAAPCGMLKSQKTFSLDPPSPLCLGSSMQRPCQPTAVRSRSSRNRTFVAKYPPGCWACSCPCIATTVRQLVVNGWPGGGAKVSPAHCGSWWLWRVTFSEINRQFGGHLKGSWRP